MTGLLKVDFFPRGDEDNFTVNVETEAGTELDKTSEIVKKAEEILIANKEVDSFSTSVGVNSEGTRGSHYAAITVNLNKNRSDTSMVIAKNVRGKVKTIKDAKINIMEKSS